MTTPEPTPAPSWSRLKIELLIGIVLLGAFVWIATAWLDEHDNRIRAEASIAQEQKLFQQYSDQIKQLQEADKSRDAQTASTIAKLSEAAAAQKTPQQITNWLPSQLGQLPVPIKSSIAPATPDNPTPPAVFTVPEADLTYLRNEVAACQKNAVALSGAQQDLSSCQAQAKLAGEKLAAMTKERDDLQQELKGGTFWQRVKSGLKKVAISAAIGAAAVCASGHCK